MGIYHDATAESLNVSNRREACSVTNFGRPGTWQAKSVRCTPIRTWQVLVSGECTAAIWKMPNDPWNHGLAISKKLDVKNFLHEAIVFVIRHVKIYNHKICPATSPPILFSPTADSARLRRQSGELQTPDPLDRVQTPGASSSQNRPGPHDRD
ncbi:hypothetical protein CCHR01_03821 [Colletotrichum chrysophilum]|uniref:Uncharacterized protein n=1 Tax=Colletotrichum chrysophilum TaxID=1836956 RepID=A0AAD9AXC3_9PEZI|nr:hypothetical protein CCHR01_03821 [Colletotrichum chrysophilum]